MIAFEDVLRDELKGVDIEAVRVCDVRTGKSLHTFVPRGYPSAVAFSPDGKMLAVVSVVGEPDSYLTLYNAVSGHERSRKNLGRAQPSVVVFAPDGQSVAVPSSKTIELYKVPSSP